MTHGNVDRRQLHASRRSQERAVFRRSLALSRTFINILLSCVFEHSELSCWGRVDTSRSSASDSYRLQYEETGPV